MLKAAVIHVSEGCDCEEWIDMMNCWTIQENVENRQRIIDRLKDRYIMEKLSVRKMIWTGILIVCEGVVPTIANLVDAAIERARERQP